MVDTAISANAEPTVSGANTHARMSYLEALVQAQIEELGRDERVIMMAEDIAIYGDGKIVETFDETRIWSMPISETSFTGMGIGAAISGLRPIVSLNIASFMYLAADPIINQAAKLRFMTGGQVSVPIVIRCCMYYNASIAAQHSDRPYPAFLNVPGLKILCPSTPADIKGLLKSVVRDNDPVIIFEDTKLWPIKGDVPLDPEFLIPIGKADIKREGEDVTILAVGGAMRHAMSAADNLAQRGISAEVVDPRTLKPIDKDTILASVRKTGRLILVENAHKTSGFTAEIAAITSEEAFESLKCPIQRVSTPDVHMPFSPTLEAQLFPDEAKIVDAVLKIA